MNERKKVITLADMIVCYLKTLGIVYNALSVNVTNGKSCSASTDLTEINN